ncbi:hypothetical protein [Sphaerisporangium sp. TRM90804]|uniref:hypothetical protein n=1 Tax=Sphaerisporangium sp. TRM90804 TaxID=3031113 RepID=UPI0024488FA4|nr:hypothetical protein [Sphaerisporangium sp. TRM90804]MDH2429582.1 hypothetical protein [Sphaerisporangium sp. TRM90804]
MRAVEGDDDERVLSPEDSLRLINDQRAEMNRRLGLNPLLFYVPWGVAWFVGFGAFFLRHGLSGEPYVDLSRGASLTVLLVSIGVALAFTGYAGWRQGHHVRGESQDRGAMYGLTWSAAYITMSFVASRFVRHLPPDEADLLWASLSIWVVSIMLMAGGAVWRLRAMFAGGAAIAVVNAAGVAAGPGWHALLMSVVVGGGYIVAALVLRRRMAKA